MLMNFSKEDMKENKVYFSNDELVILSEIQKFSKGDNYDDISESKLLQSISTSAV